MKLITFDEIINKFLKWFDKEKRNIFVFTIIFGFMANILVIASDILFADSIVFTDYYVANIWDLSLGRWALHYVEGFRFGISSAVISTTLSLLYLGMMVVLQIDLLNLKSKFSKYIYAVLACCSPFFYETLFSTFCASEFILACFLATLSVYIIYKKKNNIINTIISALILACSLGLYQSHLCVATALCIIVPIIYILKDEDDIKNLIKKVLISIVMGILAIVFYEIILNIILKIWDVSLSSYSGANEIGLKNITMLPQLIGDAYHSFYSFFFTNEIINNLIYGRDKLNIICFALIIVAMLIHLYNLYKNKKLSVLRIVILVVCLLLTPICFSIVEIIAPERDVNQLMASSFVLLYLFVLTIIEFDNYKILKTLINYIGIFACIYLAVTYFVMANASYMATRITKERIVNTSSRILDVIYSNDDYEVNMPVMFAGNGEAGILMQRTNEVYKYTSGITAVSPMIWGSNIDNCNQGWKKFINYYLGMNINVVDYETHMKIMQTKEFAEMPVYPKKDSIKIIDGVMVVKLDEESSTTQ